MRPLDAAAAGDYTMEPQHLAWQAALARPRQKAAHPGAVRAAGSSDRTLVSPRQDRQMLRSRRSATAYRPSQRSSRGSLISAIFSILALPSTKSPRLIETVMVPRWSVGVQVDGRQTPSRPFGTQSCLAYMPFLMFSPVIPPLALAHSIASFM